MLIRGVGERRVRVPESVPCAGGVTMAYVNGLPSGSEPVSVIRTGVFFGVDTHWPSAVGGRLRPTVANVAVTAVSAVSATTHVPVPVQPPPDQPVNVEPASGVAVNVTDVPFAKLALHVAPHAIPAGALDTEPDPVPAFVTERLCFTTRTGERRRDRTCRP